MKKFVGVKSGVKKETIYLAIKHISSIRPDNDRPHTHSFVSLAGSDNSIWIEEGIDDVLAVLERLGEL